MYGQMSEDIENTFLGYKSYPILWRCEHCGDEYDPEYHYEHEHCEEEHEEDE